MYKKPAHTLIITLKSLIRPRKFIWYWNLYVFTHVLIQRVKQLNALKKNMINPQPNTLNSHIYEPTKVNTTHTVTPTTIYIHVCRHRIVCLHTVVATVVYLLRTRQHKPLKSLHYSIRCIHTQYTFYFYSFANVDYFDWANNISMSHAYSV